MTSCDLATRVRELRALRYTPREIATVLGIGKAEATRLVRAAAADEQDQAREPSCWVSPGWSHGLRIDDRLAWPRDREPGPERSGSGLAVVLLAEPEPHSRVSTCCFLVDTWCLGVKNTLPSQSMSVRRFAAHRADVFAPWSCEGTSVALELGRHLVLGAVQFARTLGFEPHRDFTRAQPALGGLDEPCAIEFGRDGMPFYVNGPDDDAESVLAALERTVGPGGYHYSVQVADFADDRYDHSAVLTDLENAA